VGRLVLILADTHIVIWLAHAPEKLSSTGVAAITAARSGGGLSISDMTLWEISKLYEGRRITLRSSLEAFLKEVENNFSVLAMTGEICARALDFHPTFPKNPADRIIAATALVQGIPLITADATMRSLKGLKTVW
jgi:PIN domain nuclease of toxin-antitoxin system